MFENLSSKLQDIFKKLRGKGKLSEKDISDVLREIRLSLLEADVHFKVVKDFIEKIRQKATGVEVLESLIPAQQVIKIVHQELRTLLGEESAKISLASLPPTIILLVGLQGSGKTTTAAKLSHYFKKQGHNVLLVAADVYRPAAIKQLKILGGQINVEVYSEDLQDVRLSEVKNVSNEVVKIIRNAIDIATAGGKDVVIIDSAGRLHIDEEMMAELKKIVENINPTEVLFVTDAMVGQDAVLQAQHFNTLLSISGIILTKCDGDARGGAALSVKSVIGKPIKFVGVGEKLSQFELFHPDRFASQILGMGDMLTLIEKAEGAFDLKKAEELEKKLRKQMFTLEDFKEQLQQIKKMGPISQLLDLIPGFSALRKKQDIPVEEKNLKVIEAIINSMTRSERQNPQIIDASRKRRIAKGSGTQIQDVNQLLKQFEQTKKMLKQIQGMGKEMKFSL